MFCIWIFLLQYLLLIGSKFLDSCYDLPWVSKLNITNWFKSFFQFSGVLLCFSFIMIKNSCLFGFKFCDGSFMSLDAILVCSYLWTKRLLFRYYILLIDLNIRNLSFIIVNLYMIYLLFSLYLSNIIRISSDWRLIWINVFDVLSLLWINTCYSARCVFYARNISLLLGL